MDLSHLPPAIAFQSTLLLGVETEGVYTAIHFIALGMGIHFLFDYVHPKTQTHSGAEWPVRPSI